MVVKHVGIIGIVLFVKILLLWKNAYNIQCSHLYVISPKYFSMLPVTFKYNKKG